MPAHRRIHPHRCPARYHHRLLIQLALDAGCLFSIDTDAHAPGQLAFLDYGCARATANEVPVDRIVNTWPLDRLLEWTHAKR